MPALVTCRSHAPYRKLLNGDSFQFHMTVFFVTILNVCRYTCTSGRISSIVFPPLSYEINLPVSSQFILYLTMRSDGCTDCRTTKIKDVRMFEYFGRSACDACLLQLLKHQSSIYLFLGGGCVLRSDHMPLAMVYRTAETWSNLVKNGSPRF